ncbi:MAG: hypothetical protein COB85_06625 [Bacteroidetes bacterium]|nr:MAG: hypothetical protein COB85_06625 [Bacteroidota bacterium]
MAKSNVDNVPRMIWPLYMAISILLALSTYFLFVFWRVLCRVEYQGTEYLDPTKNYIYCMWHENLMAYFLVNLRYSKKYIWLNHPAWYMKPIHLILFFMGNKKLALGSSGNSGREALQVVIEHLKLGYNTLINPDGPSGPLKELKSGVLDMSAESGVEVVPFKIITPSAWTLKFTWDCKRMPFPFSKIIVEYGKPVQVRADDYDEARERIIAQM